MSLQVVLLVHAESIQGGIKHATSLISIISLFWLLIELLHPIFHNCIANLYLSMYFTQICFGTYDSKLRCIP